MVGWESGDFVVVVATIIINVVIIVSEHFSHYITSIVCMCEEWKSRKKYGNKKVKKISSCIKIKNEMKHEKKQKSCDEDDGSSQKINS